MARAAYSRVMGIGTVSRAYGIRLLFKPRVQRGVLVALLLVGLAIRLLQFLNFTGEPDWGFDLSFYWTAGQHVLDGESVYAPFQTEGPYPPQGVEYEYLYPPFLAVVVSPLVALIPDHRAANWLWAGVGAAILALVVVLVSRREQIREQADRLLLVGAALALGPVVSELILGNVHLLVLGLLAAAWLALRRETSRGDLVAGALVGVAALIKLFPALMVVWFVLTGRTRAAVAAAVTLVGLSVATLPVVGLGPWLDYPIVLANLSPPTELTFVLAPSAWLSEVMPARLAQVVVMSAGLATVAWVSRRRSPVIGVAVTVTVAILVTPALYPHYLAIMVLPLLLGVRHVRPIAWIAVAYVLMLGLEIDAFGDARLFVTRALLSIGPLVLLAGLIWFGRASDDRALGATGPPA